VRTFEVITPADRVYQFPRPTLLRDQGRDCGAAEIQRIAENASRWPDVNLAAEYESEAPY
jgi:hypothetical protein